MNASALTESLAAQVAQLKADKAEILDALETLSAACDTGMVGMDGLQQGVRVPDKWAVLKAKYAIEKHKDAK